ncbi:hypothetical protein [Defluviimonas salinarum]|uniref:Uncharacterized protein n=1 Tax=Defluviimonas salinarum TaxID=2992147 RepID=A0ABT3JA29_9RHOB|nr:hypothetical protein [Defluviimonas salinarum]MCW3784526.1 hypothetical protein [Defluviimonas salinarum]
MTDYRNAPLVPIAAPGRASGVTALARIGHLRSDMPALAGAALAIVAPARISPAAGVTGTVFSLIPPLIEGAPRPSVSLTVLTLGGVDVRDQVVAGRFTAPSAGALLATWTAANGLAEPVTATAAAVVADYAAGAFSGAFSAAFDRAG